MNVLSDNNTALLVMSSAEVYKISISNLTVLSAFPKILLDGVATSTQVCSINEDLMIIGFFVSSPGSNGALRLLNYSSDQYSAIYKDRILNGSSQENYPSRVMFNGTTVVHNLSPTNSTSSDRPAHLVEIRLNPMGYVYQSSTKQYNGTISLVGYSKGETMQFNPINYYYPYVAPEPISIDTTDYHRSDWNRWYFWFLLVISILVLITLGIFLYVCIARRKERSSSALDIGFTTVNP